MVVWFARGCGNRACYCLNVALLGIIPAAKRLAGIPCFGKKGEETKEAGDSGSSGVMEKAAGSGDMGGSGMAERVSTLFKLLNAAGGGIDGVSGGPAGRHSKVWLGEGLGSINKKTYDRMLQWDFIEMGELQVKRYSEKVSMDSETERLIILPGFEVAKARNRPVVDIMQWIQCYSRYVAGMAEKFPDAVPGLMSHLMIVVKAFVEVEEPAWRQYDEFFREKMAATGVRMWKGMDIGLYQEVCGGKARKGHAKSSTGAAGVLGKRPGCCWKFNEGSKCSFGAACKFMHKCDLCGGEHPRVQCKSGKRQKL